MERPATIYVYGKANDQCKINNDKGSLRNALLLNWANFIELIYYTFFVYYLHTFKVLSNVVLTFGNVLAKSVLISVQKPSGIRTQYKHKHLINSCL